MLARKALSDLALISPKGTSVPFLTEVRDSRAGLLKRSDGMMCYRTTPNEKFLAGIRLGTSTVATLESILGEALEAQCETIQKNEGGSTSWRHKWVYRAPNEGGTLTVEFVAQADSAEIQPQDSVQIESVFIQGSGFDSKAGTQVGDSVWKIDEFYGLAYQGNEAGRGYIDFIIEDGVIAAIHLYY